MKTRKNGMQDGTVEWILSGKNGAVNFLVFPVPEGGYMQPCCIGVHSRLQSKKGKCDVLPEGKCHEYLFRSHGQELWKSSRLGKDDRRIWEELAGWYARQLGKD